MVSFVLFLMVSLVWTFDGEFGMDFDGEFGMGFW